jgi:hypothetical protein
MSRVERNPLSVDEGNDRRSGEEGKRLLYLGRVRLQRSHWNCGRRWPYLADHPDDNDPHWEFVRIDKRLNWMLLKRAAHEVSVFHRGLGEHLDAPMPGYMAKQPGNFNGWRSAQRIAVALETARSFRSK